MAENIVQRVISAVTGKEVDISQYEEMVRQMVKRDDDLISFLEDIDDVVHGEWNLPPDVENLDWVAPYVSSDPSSALDTAVRTLSSEEFEIFIEALSPDKGVRDKLDKLEYWLKWQLRMADYRTDKNLVDDIARSACTYDRCAIHVTHLGMELEAMEDAGLDVEKWKNDVGTYGKFAYKLANAKEIFFQRGKWGLEAVAHVYKCRISEAIADYGPLAIELKKAYEERGFDDFWVTVVDLTTKEKRVVWVSEGTTLTDYGDVTVSDTDPMMPSKWVLIHRDRTLPFIPWAIRSGGTDLETESKHKVKPLLGRVVLTNLHDIQNTILSLTYSEAIATSAAPRYAVIGPQGNIVSVDYRDPTRLMPVPEGHELIPLDTRTVDEGMLHLSDRIKAMMDRETVARFLQNLDMPDGVAYASINAVMQAAISALDRYKDLSENVLSDVCVIMLKYMTARKDVDIIYGSEEEGSQAYVSWEDYDVDRLYIRAELSANAPTDYMQRINAAVAMNQQLKFPLEEAYRFLNVPNPKQIIDRHTQETMDSFAVQQYLMQIQAMNQIKIQQAAQAAAQQQSMAMQQAQAQSARAQGMGRGPVQNPRNTPSAAPRSEEERAAFELARMMGGRNFNTGQGGEPPATTSPGSTREVVTGRDRGGNQRVI